MKNIQTALKNFFEGNTYCKQIMQYAAIVLYVYVAYEIIGMLPLPTPISSILSYFSAILYFAYLVCLVMCFAKNDMMPIFILFLYFTLSPVYSLIRWGVSFNGIVRIIVYGMVAYWAFKQTFQSSPVNNVMSMPEADKVFCPNCGKQMSRNSEFCGSCGTKVK